MTLWLITAFCTCVLCTGPYHGRDRTASGSRPVAGYTVACPKELPFGTVLEIEGVGIRWCEDRGSSIKGRRLDVLMATHEEAKKLKRLALVRALHIPWGPQ